MTNEGLEDCGWQTYGFSGGMTRVLMRSMKVVATATNQAAVRCITGLVLDAAREVATG